MGVRLTHGRLVVLDGVAQLSWGCWLVGFVVSPHKHTVCFSHAPDVTLFRTYQTAGMTASSTVQDLWARTTVYALNGGYTG